MICPNCKCEFEEEFTECKECECKLIDNPNQEEKKEKIGWLFSFGKVSAQDALKMLYYIGIIPILISSYFYGRFVFLTNKYEHDINLLQNGRTVYSSELVNNFPLGLVVGITAFIVELFLWKIICELLLIMFRAFETYHENNKAK